MKAIEEVQQLNPDPKYARANSLNLPLAGNRETPKGREDHAMKKKLAIRDAVQKKLRG
jgi:hypothetical protein